jgi:hypothetical protein
MCVVVGIPEITICFLVGYKRILMDLDPPSLLSRLQFPAVNFRAFPPVNLTPMKYVTG